MTPKLHEILGFQKKFKVNTQNGIQKMFENFILPNFNATMCEIIMQTF